ncbi:TIGR03087 family PEP-CTERM/XrtA system glycosyltransferase [Roseomonas sp. CCTCC AB2023176]|uniref:TIGR03087 family PEP-CTERM/XrtA system glycosyltransferase n=1 Tax=Roseomonas sp. CCTCC AB2023176 TaxID=3342640 RepID=UPI0035E13C28
MNRRLLFLAHRIPYPPEKGEKIRSWHMLSHLARDWEVELGCLVDDPADLDHLPFLRTVCARVEAPFVGSKRSSALRALLRARPGAPLSLGWFHDTGLATWVDEGLAARRYGAALAYSSAVAPYVMGDAARSIRRRVLDLVDVDSEKWRAYAADARLPMRYVWAREATTLLAFERRAAMEFDRAIFVSEEEARCFARLAPECADRLDHVDNGVDLSRFAAASRGESPFGNAPAIVFTGTMDYRPNVEAVTWFADAVLPRLRDRDPAPDFWIVGQNPSAAVRALADRPGVHVTGPVPDVRPYIGHAAVAVAPLLIARGIQNKVLEAMAMARPVVATPQAYEGVRASAGRDLLVADGAEETAARVAEVLDGRHPGLGDRARAAVMSGHDWGATLRRLDAILEGTG